MEDLKSNGGLLTLTEGQIKSYPQYKVERDENVANIIIAFISYRRLPMR